MVKPGNEVAPGKGVLIVGLAFLGQWRLSGVAGAGMLFCLIGRGEPGMDVQLLENYAARHGPLQLEPKNCAVGRDGLHRADVDNPSPLVEFHFVAFQGCPVVDWPPCGDQSTAGVLII
jgi:hypothetical protein